MRSLARFALLLLFLPPLPVFAAPDEPKSDAARFDFAGPIKSVSTTSARTDVESLFPTIDLQVPAFS
jgi:hypothetical protein